MSGRRVSIADENGNQIAPCLYQLREDEDALYLYVCNTGQKQFGKNEGDGPSKSRPAATFPHVRIDVFAEGKGRRSRSARYRRHDHSRQNHRSRLDYRAQFRKTWQPPLHPPKG